jgi:hypothetical protein
LDLPLIAPLQLKSQQYSQNKNDPDELCSGIADIPCWKITGKSTLNSILGLQNSWR